MGRIFLIGYEPPGWNFGVLEYNLPMCRKLEKLMDEADLAALVPGGWAVGRVMFVGQARFICTHHEHDGKIVRVRPWGTRGKPD